MLLLLTTGATYKNRLSMWVMTTFSPLWQPSSQAGAWTSHSSQSSSSWCLGGGLTCSSQSSSSGEVADDSGLGVMADSGVGSTTTGVSGDSSGVGTTTGVTEDSSGVGSTTGVTAE